VDVLYILGRGSRWGDNEIRYSLRGVDRYLPHRQVFVVGVKPDWLTNVIHIPAEDIYRAQKQANSIHKLTVALADRRLESRVALMNDDFFITKPVTLPLAYHHRGDLGESVRKHPTRRGYYWTSLRAMLAELAKRGVGHPKDYSLHIPMEIDADKARWVCAEMAHLKETGYMWRTAYCNLAKVGGTRLRDVKVFRRWVGVPRDFHSFSTDPSVVLHQNCRKALQTLYPGKSQFESDKGSVA